MKKFLKHLCALCTIVAIVLAGGQEPDGSMDTTWTLTCLAIALVFGGALRFLLGDEKEDAK